MTVTSEAGALKVVAFDKTGTLMRGTLELTDTVMMESDEAHTEESR
ncbi:MAG: hypothetical protein ACQETQ_07015 [Spirochaetota bacterium]